MSNIKMQHNLIAKHQILNEKLIKNDLIHYVFFKYKNTKRIHLQRFLDQQIHKT